VSPVVEFAVPFQTFSDAGCSPADTPINDIPVQPFVFNALSSFKTAHVYMVDTGGTVIAADNLQNVDLPLSSVSSLRATALSLASPQDDETAEHLLERADTRDVPGQGHPARKLRFQTDCREICTSAATSADFPAVRGHISVQS
jgi:hypothetical protein